MNKENTNYSTEFTVGITTCYGGPSLVETAQSILQSTGVPLFRFIIIADRTPIQPFVKAELERLGVELYWNETPGGIFTKLKEMRAMITTDILVLTQDDVRFTEDTLQKLLQPFKYNPRLTLAGSRILSKNPTTFFEKVMGTMLSIVRFVGRTWRAGDNFLTASGRCIAYRTEHLKKFRLPDKIVNCDMFSYLENKRLKGFYQYVDASHVYIAPPQRLKEQLKPSSRFQYAKTEMRENFDYSLTHEFKIPVALIIRTTALEFIRHPILTLSYLCTFLYTRIRRIPQKSALNPFWSPELSTKRPEKI